MNPFGDLPMGLGMALMQHPQAMEHFANLDDSKQKEIIDQTHSIKSRKEMQAFVSRLAENR